MRDDAEREREKGYPEKVAMNLLQGIYQNIHWSSHPKNACIFNLIFNQIFVFSSTILGQSFSEEKNLSKEKLIVKE